MALVAEKQIESSANKCKSKEFGAAGAYAAFSAGGAL